MRTLLITILVLIFASCSSDKRHDKTTTVSHTSVNIPPPPGTRMTAEFKDIDTTINLSFYNLASYAVNVSGINKKKLITEALRSARVENSKNYKSKDFYFIDFDNDGDLDLIYSSNIDQYKLIDANFLLLLENKHGKYNQYKIAGYLYCADFSKISHGQIILKTVTRPCCDYLNYNFFETSFNTKTWTLNTKHVLEIHNSKVHEE